MQLADEFTVSADPDRAYAWLLDLRRVAPCVPGGEIGEPSPEGVYPGRVSVKLGPMKFVYDGRVRIAERDESARTAVIEGEGKAGGGAETARVRTVMAVVPEGTGSRVRVTTDLDIKGRAAQMGQGVISDVSKRLLGQAAACIEARLSAPEGADEAALPTAGDVGGIGLMASVMGSKVSGGVKRLNPFGRGGDDPAPGDKPGDQPADQPQEKP